MAGNSETREMLQSFVSEAFDWEEGLNKKPSKAKNFYIVMALALIGSAMVGLIGINPMKMLFYSQIIQGVLTPLLLIFLVLICNDKKIMGKFINTWKANFWGWLTIIVMIGMSAVMFWDMLK
jgi:Mn2+/Fe2+ NRAMP family transporter